jgi:asparagine N-glycosylation enzyme membrane subunit Stt3
MIKWIGVSIIAGLILRIAPVYQAVFSPVGIKFSTPDSYYYAGRIREIVEGTGTSGGLMGIYNWICAFIIRVTTLIYPSTNVDAMLAILPLVLFVLTVPGVYLIARTLFNQKAAILASLFFSIIPGEYLGRSLLGDPDHHVAEVLVLAWVCLAFIKVLKINNLRVRWGVFIGMVVSGITVCLFISPPFFAQLYWRYIGWLTLGYSSLTQETRSIFVSPISVFALFSFLVCLGLLGWMLLNKKNHKASTLFFLAWTIANLLLVIPQRRFDYFITLNLAVLLGYFLSLRKLATTGMVFAMILIIGSMFLSSYAGARVVDLRPSNEWVTNLKWLSTQDKGKVLSWWDYGYWIEYIGKHEALVNGGQNIEDIKPVTSILLSDTESPDPMVRYVIIDEEILAIRQTV